MNPLVKRSSILTASARQWAQLAGPRVRSKATAPDSSESNEILVPAFRKSSWFRESIQHWKKNHLYNRNCLYHEVEKLTTEICSDGQILSNPVLAERVRKIIRYNVLEVNMIRGSQIMHMLRLMKIDEKLSSRAALIPEFVRAIFNISDDITDGGKSRYGKIPWFKLPNVGLLATNDATLMGCYLLEMSQKTFSNLPCYKELMHMIVECNFFTSLGQFGDEHQSRVCKPANGPVDFTKYTRETYKNIALAKAAFADSLACKTALYVSGRYSEKSIREAEVIGHKLSYLHQVVDDFLDAFFDPKSMGTDAVDTDSGDDDIRSGKLSFLIMAALESAKGEDKKLLESHYGKNDAESVSIVKKLYRKLGVIEAFSKEQDDICHQVLQLIEQWDEKNSGIPKELFPCLITTVYHNGANLSNT